VLDELLVVEERIHLKRYSSFGNFLEKLQVYKVAQLSLKIVHFS